MIQKQPHSRLLVLFLCFSLSFSIYKIANAAGVFTANLTGYYSVGSTVLGMLSGQATLMATPFSGEKLIIHQVSSGTAADEVYTISGLNVSGDAVTITTGLVHAKYTNASYTLNFATPVNTATPTFTFTYTFTPTNTSTNTSTPTSTPLPKGTIVLVANTPVFVTIAGCTTANSLNFTPLGAAAVANSTTVSCIGGGCTVVSAASVTDSWQLY